MKRVIGLLLAVILLPNLGIAQAPPFVRNDSAASINGPNLGAGSAAVDVTGAIRIGAASTGATGLGKVESSTHTTGDVGVQSLGVVNTGATTLASNGQYSPIATDVYGAVIVDLDARYNTSGVSPVRREDDAFSAAQGLMVSGGVTESAISADTSANAVGAIKIDEGGRTIITKAPPGETGSSCSTESTGTSNTAILGAVASNRWYVTSINCSNNSAVPSRITFRDGAADKAVGGVAALATNGGGLSLTFDPPIRGSVNTAFNFIMTTTATATICCATAYFSTI